MSRINPRSLVALSDKIRRVREERGVLGLAKIVALKIYRKASSKGVPQQRHPDQSGKALPLKAKSSPKQEPLRTYRYGSLTTGRDDWEAKWDASPGKRVLLYALSDYSGSFHKWAEAINRHTDYAARLVVFKAHQFGYGEDLVMPQSEARRCANIAVLVDEADIIHIKDESGFFTGSNKLPRDLFPQFGKPRVYTAYGGYMRKFADNKDFQKFVRGFDARIAMTPDLAYEWFEEGRFIPHAIDTDNFAYRWQDGDVLAHSPSTKERKGTEDLEAAIAGLSGVRYDLIHGVQHTECIERKRCANLFFDQAGTEIEGKLGISTVIGWYGNSALEAAVFGIPTIAHMSDHAFEGARRAGRDIRDQCAIINTERGPEGIRKTVQAYFSLSPDERSALSIKTRKWMEDFHSYQACARELVHVYDGLLGHTSSDQKHSRNEDLGRLKQMRSP